MNTRVLIAPDSFKGSIAAADAARALARGWLESDPDADIALRPMADGGEGTLDAFLTGVPGARRMPVRITAPASLGARSFIDSSWVLLPDGTGVVELASSAGIELYGSALRPWAASTFAFGEAIAAALDTGVRRLVLAIGSSASTDGGAGLLSALGARFTGLADDVVPAAEHLQAIAAVDLRGLRPLPSDGAIVLSDVVNPLLGPAGAVAVFGPQKGFELEELDSLAAALEDYASLLDVDPHQPGSGAAGGTGFALRAWGAVLTPGAPAVADLIGLEAAMASASLAITGEGSYDDQSAGGKVPAFVARVASSRHVPSALVAGRIGAATTPFTTAISLTELAGSPRAAMSDPKHWLHVAGLRLAGS